MRQQPRETHVTKIEQYLTENDLLITYLKQFDPLSWKQCNYAKQAYRQYKEAQQGLLDLKYHGRIPKLYYNTRSTYGKDGDTRRWLNKRRVVELRSCCCELCGNPLTDVLEVHHVVLLCMGGTHVEDNESVVCPTCHRVVHTCIEAGGIKDSIRDYYAGIEGALEKLETLVRKGIGD